jgi:predicted nucleotidyltransferase/predicted transcriptional regulator with HTH domain
MDLGYLFGSRLRAEVVGWLYSHHEERFFVRQLADMIGKDPTNISRELARLEDVGLVVSTTEGRQKYYQANRESPIFNELKGLAIKTAGVADLLHRALVPLQPEISICFIFGSMATGEIGQSSDVDVLVVGSVDDLALHRRIADVEELLRRTVNYTLLSDTEYNRRKSRSDDFIQRIVNGPKILVIGETV